MGNGPRMNPVVADPLDKPDETIIWTLHHSRGAPLAPQPKARKASLLASWGPRPPTACAPPCPSAAGIRRTPSPRPW